MDTTPNTKGESIRFSTKIKNKIKKGEKESFQTINREAKKYKHKIFMEKNESLCKSLKTIINALENNHETETG